MLLYHVDGNLPVLNWIYKISIKIYYCMISIYTKNESNQ